MYFKRKEDVCKRRGIKPQEPTETDSNQNKVLLTLELRHVIICLRMWQRVLIDQLPGRCRCYGRRECAEALLVSFSLKGSTAASATDRLPPIGMLSSLLAFVLLQLQDISIPMLTSPQQRHRLSAMMCTARLACLLMFFI
jgi:hypothetical protein